MFFYPFTIPCNRHCDGEVLDLDYNPQKIQIRWILWARVIESLPTLCMTTSKNSAKLRRVQAAFEHKTRTGHEICENIHTTHTRFALFKGLVKWPV